MCLRKYKYLSVHFLNLDLVITQYFWLIENAKEVIIRISGNNKKNAQCVSSQQSTIVSLLIFFAIIDASAENLLNMK